MQGSSKPSATFGSPSIGSRHCAFLAISACIFFLFSLMQLREIDAGTPLAEPAKADVGFVGLHGGVFERLQEAAKPLNLTVKYFSDGDISTKKADFASVQVLVLQHTRSEDRATYRDLLVAAKKTNPKLRVLTWTPASPALFDDMGKENPITEDRMFNRYQAASPENYRRVMVYIAAKYLGQQRTIEPPEQIERFGFYHPESKEMFDTADKFFQWTQKRLSNFSARPRLLIAVHHNHLVVQQPKVVDALIVEAEKQGAVAAAIVDGRSEQYERQAVLFRPHAIIHTCHSFDQTTFRKQLDVPHLHSLFFRKQSITAWEKSLEGLATSEAMFQIVGQELIGGIEPQTGAGTFSGQGSPEAFTPISERIEHLIRRSISQARLAQTPPADKRIAIIYYDREMGKSELMRGSATGMHLNAPRSVINVLKKMKEHGYRIDPLPRNEDELLAWMIERGRQVGVWAPRELDRMARTGNPVLVPAKKYREWFERRVQPDQRKALEERWGTAPGRFMVWENKGEKFIVIPRIQLGNVLMLPQPLRGEAHEPGSLNSQAHDKLTPPPHNYLATYFWLEEEFKANALVHFGTHGSEFALPGKATALSPRDWPDIIMGSMPNFNPWIIENMGESSPVRRRAYGTLISHLSPPIVNAGLSDELANLHESIDRWETLEEGPLKEEFRKQISRQLVTCKLHTELKLPAPSEGLYSKESIEKASKYIHDIAEETTPISLHILGEPPREDLLVPYLVNILREPFLKGLQSLRKEWAGAFEGDRRESVREAAREIVDLVIRKNVDPQNAVKAVIKSAPATLPKAVEQGLKLALELKQNFAKTTDEVDNLIRGLDGKFIPPGPGNNPIRNPRSVPTGRNMYLVNPDEIPLKPSWEIGKKLADELIERHKKQTGSFPTKIGFDLASFASFRDYGVMESQILWLMGVEPVWDDKNTVMEVALVPPERLGRPRIDVFIAVGGYYEMNLPGRLNLWDKAIRLVAQANEKDNLVYQNSQKLREALIKKGEAADKATKLSTARMFGYSAGQMTSPSYYYMMERSGEWDSREEIAERYIARRQHVFTEGYWGQEQPQLFREAIQGTHTVVRSWSDHMTGPLASKYNWLFGGGLSLAVEHLTGKRPEFVFSDNRDPDRSNIVNAEEALRKEYRVRLFNRKWLEGMMKEGYSGADHMQVLVSNSFGWDTMRPGSVGDDNWMEMKAILVDDKLNLYLKDWFSRNNPFAYQDTLATMLEAIRKGYWKASAETTAQLAEEYARNVARFGASGGTRSGGNLKLDGFVKSHLQTLAKTEAAIVAAYDTKIADVNFKPVDGMAPGQGAVVASALPSASGTEAAKTEPSPAKSNEPSATNAQPPKTAPANAERTASAHKPPPDAPVSGKKLEQSGSPTANESPSEHQWLPWTIALVTAFLFLFGILRRKGVEA